ncbi:MAG TPA: YdcF family protein [Methylophilaceae bacterium]|nr:YdcF family protein [Methylophilaceae bacterium]
MEWAITNFLAAFLLPPLTLLLLFGVGLWLINRRPRIALGLLTGSFVLLWAFSTPFVAESAMHALESSTATPKVEVKDAQAIVILGGGIYFFAPEYNGDDRVNSYTLQRLSYGARLHRETGLPILVTGGKALGNKVAEAELMRASLQQDFQVPVRWVEDASINTKENARYSAYILKKSGITKVHLVTHAWHMRRSAQVFRQAGLEVIEAPTAFTTRYKTDVFAFLPQAESLRDSRIFMHEVFGLLWYRLRHAAGF